MKRARAQSRSFILHKRLAADSFFVTDLALSRVLLMNDARFPWLVLVPRRRNVSELFELSLADRSILIREIAHCSQQLKTLARAEKINVGALGNRVLQLHIHIVARRRSDVAWPGPVWGFQKPEPYASSLEVRLLKRLAVALKTR